MKNNSYIVKSKLLPCAHCGKVPDVHWWEPWSNSDNKERYSVVCKCGISLDCDLAYKVVKKWNRRAK
jgi:hypothetical protein